MKTQLPKRKHLMKIKAFLLTLVVIFSVFNINSCKKEVKDRDYDEAQVLAAAKDLIQKSEKLNDIYYGYGIEADTGDINNANGYYYPADVLSLEKFGVETVNDIKALTRACFTTAQAEYMMNNTFASVKDTNGDIIHFARYYQENDSLDLNETKCIMVYLCILL